MGDSKHNWYLWAIGFNLSIIVCVSNERLLFKSALACAHCHWIIVWLFGDARRIWIDEYLRLLHWMGRRIFRWCNTRIWGYKSPANSPGCLISLIITAIGAENKTTFPATDFILSVAFACALRQSNDFLWIIRRRHICQQMPYGPRRVLISTE